MKNCPICGTQNEDSFSKCMACGSDLPASVDTGAAETGMGLRLKQSDADASGGQTAANNGTASAGGMTLAGANAPANPVENKPADDFLLDMDEPFVLGKSAPVGGPRKPSVGPEAVMSVPADRGKLFAILGAITVVTILSFVLIFTLGKGGKKGAKNKEDLPRLYVEAMDERNMDKIVNICPPFMRLPKEDLQSYFDLFDAAQLKVSYLRTLEMRDYNASELAALESDMQRIYNVSKSLDAACEISFEFSLSAPGIEPEKETSSLVVIQYKGRWYLYE